MTRIIGDKVWCARFEPMSPEFVVCPDCGGTGQITLIFHDGKHHSIDCGNCSRGYNPPTGKVLIYCQKVTAKLERIDEVRMSHEGTEYITESRHCHSDNDVFDDEASALAYGNERQAEHQKEQKKRILSKEKDTKSWAWNASYHRRNIADAKRSLEYHTAKLNVAKIKSKEGE